MCPYERLKIRSKRHIFNRIFCKRGLILNFLQFSRHGRDKFIVGAAIKGAGLLTGNQQLQQLGAGIAGLGLKTKLAAHLFPGK